MHPSNGCCEERCFGVGRRMSSLLLSPAADKQRGLSSVAETISCLQEHADRIPRTETVRDLTGPSASAPRGQAALREQLSEERTRYDVLDLQFGESFNKAQQLEKELQDLRQQGQQAQQEQAKTRARARTRSSWRWPASTSSVGATAPTPIS